MTNINDKTTGENAILSNKEGRGLKNTNNNIMSGFTLLVWGNLIVACMAVLILVLSSYMVYAYYM